MDRLSFHGIIGKLDVESLCSLACVDKSSRNHVYNEALPSLNSVQISTMSPDDKTLEHILDGCTSLETLALNCHRLSHDSIGPYLTPTIRRLSLRCRTYQIVDMISKKCRGLRVIMLELADNKRPYTMRFNRKIERMVIKLNEFESLSLTIRSEEGAMFFSSLAVHLPSTLRTLKLEPIQEWEALRILSYIHLCHSVGSSGHRLQSLSLVLNTISDKLLEDIATTLPFLEELDLEDKTSDEALDACMLTHNGFQHLSSCRRLTGLSLVRGRLNHQVTFKGINDTDMLLLSGSCNDLESVRFHGFSEVTDAGYASFLRSCIKLKKFEVRNSLLLSDLAFRSSPSTLIEVTLSNRLITSETLKMLAYCAHLQTLDLRGCESITDSGLLILGRESLPITNLSLRGCEKVTDQGVIALLTGRGKLARTLTALDLGCMPGLTDRSILAIVDVEIGIVELCVRCCHNLTDEAVKGLARNRSVQRQLRSLDLCYCTGLSVESARCLLKPFCRGLHWVGISQLEVGNFLDTVHEERPWLTVCQLGCEIGCNDGWQNHESV